MLQVSQLCGFNVSGEGGGPPTAVFYQDEAAIVASALTCPSVLAGDLLVFLERAFVSGSTPTTAVPSGFAAISNVSGSNTRVILSYKIADGSESGSAIEGMSVPVSGALWRAMLTFRGDNPITAVIVADPDGVATTGNPSAQVVTSGSGAPPLVVFGGYVTSGTVNPRTFTPAKDGEVMAAGDSLWLAYKIYNSAPSNVSVDMDDEGNNFLVSCYIECAGA